MSLRRPPVGPIDRQQVHWAGGEDDDAIHFRAERDGVAGCTQRGAPFQLAVLQDRDVHKKVQRAGCLRRGHADIGQRFVEVFGAIVVMPDMTELFVTLRVARRDQGVVHARTGVGGHVQDIASPVRNICISDIRIGFLEKVEEIILNIRVKMYDLRVRAIKFARFCFVNLKFLFFTFKGFYGI